mmetsp:Transcript_34080/g.63193  ORF Transcript_34080/g.63193 Transcript_34080/m.63193 type:complete len:342 (-) Transcript_34080:77-1102(-)
MEQKVRGEQKVFAIVPRVRRRRRATPTTSAWIECGIFFFLVSLIIFCIVQECGLRVKSLTSAQAEGRERIVMGGGCTEEVFVATEPKSMTEKKISVNTSLLATLALQLKRIERKKSSPYFLGRFTSSRMNISVGLRRDKGNKMHYRLLFSDALNEESGMGFLLFEERKGCLALKGMSVRQQYRKRGLSKHFMAIWLIFTLSQGFQPRANNIEKPIIAFLLRKFNFSPIETSRAFELSLVENKGEEVHLWSAKNNAALFNSTFSKNHCRAQRIRLLSQKPRRGVTVYLKTGYILKDIESGLKRAHTALGSLQPQWEPSIAPAVRRMHVPVLVPRLIDQQQFK